MKAGEVCGAASPCGHTSLGQGRLEEQHAPVPAAAASLWVLSTPARAELCSSETIGILAVEGGRGDANPGATYPNLLAWGFVRAGLLIGFPLWT